MDHRWPRKRSTVAARNTPEQRRGTSPLMSEQPKLPDDLLRLEDLANEWCLAYGDKENRVYTVLTSSLAFELAITLRLALRLNSGQLAGNTCRNMTYFYQDLMKAFADIDAEIINADWAMSSLKPRTEKRNQSSSESRCDGQHE